jgi:hypothetical protein
MDPAAVGTSTPRAPELFTSPAKFSAPKGMRAGGNAITVGFGGSI